MKLNINEFGLSICNQGPNGKGPINTSVGPTGKSTVDYIMVPQEMVNRVYTCQVLSYDMLNTSDHRPIQIVIDIDKLTSNTVTKVRSGIKRWDRLDSQDVFVRYTEPLEVSTRHILYKLSHPVSESDLDKCIDKLISKMHDAAKSIPTSRFRKQLKPFWYSRLDDLKKEKILTYKS